MTTVGDGGANERYGVTAGVACSPLLVLSTAPKYDGAVGDIVIGGFNGDVSVGAGVVYAMLVAV